MRLLYALLAAGTLVACDRTTDRTTDRAPSPGDGSATTVGPATVAARDCVRDTTARHDDPVALVEEWMRREAEGPMEREDIAAAFPANALTCEARPGDAPYAIATSFRVRPLKLTNYAAAVLVEWTRAFTLAADSASGRERLVEAPATIVDTVQVIRTAYGWRIASLPSGTYRLPSRALAERPSLAPEARATLQALARRSGH